jgi:hypothetical protein
MIVQSVLRFLKRIWVAPQDPSSPTGGYWSVTPTEVSEENPLPVDISSSGPLVLNSGGSSHIRVWVGNDWGSPVPTEPTSLDTLLYSSGLNPTQSATASPANTDLFGNINQETATIVRAESYRRFILTGWVSAAATLTVDIYARATDPNGAPLHTGGSGVWFLLGSPSVSASGYFRIVLEAADGKFPGFDQYRFCIRKDTASSITVNLVLRGER